MAVTSRDLHRQPTRATVVARPAQWPRMRVDSQYLKLGLLIICLFVMLQFATGRGQTVIDDLRYGRPRTMQVSAYVGHSEHPGQPSHFIAMNLNRRVVVIELPGGDSTKARTLQGPYLFGANEDMPPVLVRVQDVNADKQGDLVIAVKNEEIIYINSGDSFRLINDAEREHLLGAQR